MGLRDLAALVVAVSVLADASVTYIVVVGGGTEINPVVGHVANYYPPVLFPIAGLVLLAVMATLHHAYALGPRAGDLIAATFAGIGAGRLAAVAYSVVAGTTGHEIYLGLQVAGALLAVATTEVRRRHWPPGWRRGAGDAGRGENCGKAPGLRGLHRGGDRAG